MLRYEDYAPYISTWNREDEELYGNQFPNRDAGEFLAENIPLLDFPDKSLEITYYFRWWTFRKHIRKLPDGGHVITEFLPDVIWAGPQNSINCAAGHHIMEGRWLRDSSYLADNFRFWYRSGALLRHYGTWLEYGMRAFCEVTGDRSLAEDLLTDMEDDLRGWEESKPGPFGGRPNGMFFITDDREGSEYSIGGSRGGEYRCQLNSAMVGNYRALADLARMLGREELAGCCDAKATRLRNRILLRMWDAQASFFKPFYEDGSLSHVRELQGYAPWYFFPSELPAECDAAFRFLVSREHFLAPYGLTYPEQCHPDFRLLYEGHECRWNGPVWPYAESMALTALANRLTTPTLSAPPVSAADFYNLTLTYARAQRRTLPDGRIVPWIDEDQHPYTGDWISRTILEKAQNPNQPRERGKDYNHSTFCDLVISGICGIRPQPEGFFVQPLVTPLQARYFCLDRVRLQGHDLTVFYDEDGQRYGRGAGMQVLVDDRVVFAADTICRTPLIRF